MATKREYTRRGAKNRRLVRQWELVLTLTGRRHGATLKELEERLGVSKKTVQRELTLLTSAGVPIERNESNGTVRWRLSRDSDLPTLGLSALQVAALGIARAGLEPLSGSTCVKELDALLQAVNSKSEQFPLRLASVPPGNPEALAAIERAVKHGVQLRMDYRAVSRRGWPERVHVEPLVLNLADNTPYLLAYCVERRARRTYRLSRIASAEVTTIPARRVPSEAEARAFDHAVKAWSGEPTLVRVRLSPSVAWLASDFPLKPNQTLESNSDHSVTVSATVAGTVEAMRWVLSWGAEAEVLDPVGLRDATQGELERALSRYRPVRKTTGPQTKRDKHAVAGGE